MPKIGIVIPGFQSSPDDWCIPAFTNLARELSKHASVHVFALRYPARRSRYAVGKVQVHSTGGGALAGRRIAGASLLNLWWQALRDIETEHRRGPFSALVGFWATEAGWLATRAGMKLGLPVLVHLAGGELAWLPAIRYGNHHRGLAGLLVSRTLRDAHLLTVPSEPIARQLVQHYPGYKCKTRHWSLGVDTSMFNPGEQPSRAHTPAGPFTFLSVGSLLPVKDHAWPIRACAVLRNRQPDLRFRVIVAGSGPLLPHLRRLINDSELQGYVSLVGEIPHGRLPTLMRASDCFVLTSWHEAQCMALLEAAACGLPWIAPPVGAAPDLLALSHSPSGILMERRTDPALAQALEQIATSSEATRLAYGGQGRETVMRHYQLSAQVQELLALLN